MPTNNLLWFAIGYLVLAVLDSVLYMWAMSRGYRFKRWHKYVVGPGIYAAIRTRAKASEP